MDLLSDVPSTTPPRPQSSAPGLRLGTPYLLVQRERAEPPVTVQAGSVTGMQFNEEGERDVWVKGDSSVRAVTERWDG